jgi:hypothetical protein
MEQKPYRETNICSATQEIQHILRNRKVHCRVLKIPPLEPTIVVKVTFNFNATSRT